MLYSRNCFGVVENQWECFSACVFSCTYGLRTVVSSLTLYSRDVSLPSPVQWEYWCGGGANKRQRLNTSTYH